MGSPAPARSRFRSPDLPVVRAAGALPAAQDFVLHCPAERPNSGSEPPWGRAGPTGWGMSSPGEEDEEVDAEEDEAVSNLDEVPPRDFATARLGFDSESGAIPTSATGWTTLMNSSANIAAGQTSGDSGSPKASTRCPSARSSSTSVPTTSRSP